MSAVHPSRLRPRWPVWESLRDNELLDLRLCDLGVTLRSTVLEARIQQLYRELARRGLRFRPSCWLSDEWFSPTTAPGIAIPFYLAHPRLARLEEKQMGEVEGGTKAWCMQLLRHEAGHAFETAYHLNRRRRWREVFGRASVPYPDRYTPDTSSRDFVLHLDWWYAQSHPSEDFAETFAVWLAPGSDWRERYQGWPVFRKLQYMEELAAELGGRPAANAHRASVHPLRHVRKTLRQHYAERRARYGVSSVDRYDRDLRRLFGPRQHVALPPASSFLRRTAPELRQLIGTPTAEHAYTFNSVLKDTINRCRALNLRVARPPGEIKHEAAILLAAKTRHYFHSSDISFVV